MNNTIVKWLVYCLVMSTLWYSPVISSTTLRGTIGSLLTRINTTVIQPWLDNVYYLLNASNVGYSFKECIENNRLDPLARQAIQQTCSRFPKHFIKKIRFVFNKQESPLKTPAAALRNLIIIYPSFFSFNLEEQRGILAHELIHVQDNHTTLSILISLSITGASLLYSYYYPTTSTQEYILSCIAWNILSFVIMRRVHNALERSADCQAAHALNNAQGLISVFKGWRHNEPEVFSGILYDSWCDWFSVHPKITTRIAYLTQLQRELDEEKYLYFS